MTKTIAGVLGTATLKKNFATSQRWGVTPWLAVVVWWLLLPQACHLLAMPRGGASKGPRVMCANQWHARCNAVDIVALGRVTRCSGCAHLSQPVCTGWAPAHLLPHHKAPIGAQTRVPLAPCCLPTTCLGDATKLIN